MTAPIGSRTTFGKGLRPSRFDELPKEFPFTADLVTRRDDEWQYTPVVVIGGNRLRFRIRAIQPTVIPGLPRPLPPNVTIAVPGFSLQPHDQRPPA